MNDKTDKSAADAGGDLKNLTATIHQQIQHALKLPLLTYLKAIKANPTLATIQAGVPAIAAEGLAAAPALQSEIITDVADLLIQHLETPTAETSAVVSAMPAAVGADAEDKAAVGNANTAAAGNAGPAKA